MKCNVLFVITLSLFGCGRSDVATLPDGGASDTATLREARQGFQTTLARRESANEPVEQPPAGVFNLVQYESPAGTMAAYVTPDPGDGQKHPAIVWITGGDCSTIGDVWSPASPDNDQTAAAYRQAGLVMMFPSLRGGNQNPGVHEGFLGEVDDVLAAADFLAGQSYVDASRIYLGGHSTGGTLALLVSECSDRFRAVFSFGPVADVRGYGDEYCPFDLSDAREVKLRSPGYWLASVKSPTFVIEGEIDSNLESLQQMAQATSNPQVQFLPVKKANHFDVLAPANALIARKIQSDNGPKCNIELSEGEILAGSRN